MGIDQRLRDVEDKQIELRKDHDHLDTAVEKVCLAVETAMGIQQEHSIHLKILQRIVYGAVAMTCLAVGGAIIDVVVRSHVPTADRVEQAK